MDILIEDDTREVRSSLAAKVSPETLETTRAACEFLHDIALHGVQLGTTDPAVPAWLENLGRQCVVGLQAHGQWPDIGRWQ